MAVLVAVDDFRFSEGEGTLQTWHADVGNIDSPDLIGPDNRHFAQKIRSYILAVIALAQVRLWVDSVYAHVPHQPPDFLPVDGSARLAPQNLRDGPVAPGRFIGMEGLSIILCSNPSDSVNANVILPFRGRRWTVVAEFGPSSEFYPSICA